MSLHLLENQKRIAPKVVQVCKTKAGAGTTYDRSPRQFANMYLNRDFYIAMQDYLWERIGNGATNKEPHFSKTLQIKVWLLQSIHQTTSSCLFEKHD